MPSELKHLMADELSQRYPSGIDYLVVGCARLGGPETTEFRRMLRENRVRMEVVKNSIAIRVLEQNGLGAGVGLLQKPSALVIGQVEMPELCRIISDCVREFRGKLIIRGGLMGGSVLTAGKVAELARIPPLPVLHARILGGIQAPIAGLTVALHGLLRSLACALEGIRRQREGEAPPSSPLAAAAGASPGGHA